MKYVLCLGICFLSSCEVELGQSLDFVFAEHLKTKPTRTSTYFAHSDKFCSQSLWLNDDSTFTMESGCEGRSTVHRGSWNEQNGTVNLIESPELTGLLGHVKWSESRAYSDTLVVRCYDVCGQPVEDVACVLYNGGLVNKDSRVFTTNDHGMSRFSLAEFDSLHFPLLDDVRYNLLAKGLPDTLELFLNINAGAIMYPGFQFHNDWVSMELIRTDSGLTMSGIELISRKEN